MNKIPSIAIGIIVALLGFILFVALVNAQQDTCPDGNGWTKINSGDLSQYPVEDATYCFKAGNWIDSVYPVGGFGQEGTCTEGIQYCALSHWSYFVDIPTVTSTPTPTLTPRNTSTPTPSPTPSLTPTPTSTPTPTPTDTPSDTNDTSTTETTWEEVREIEGEVYGPLK